MRTHEQMDTTAQLGHQVNVIDDIMQIPFSDMGHLGECLAAGLTVTVVMRAAFLSPEWAQAHIAAGSAKKLDELARALIEAAPVAMEVAR